MKTIFSLLLLALSLNSSLIAQPEPSSSEEPLNVKILRDVVYGRKAGMALTMDVIQPLQNKNRAAVVFIASHGW